MEKAKLERAAYRRGIMRTAAIASVILAVILALAWQVRSKARANYHQANAIRSTTVRLTVANGLNPASSGDWLSAALWFSEAFALDETFHADADTMLMRQTHRLRLNSLLRQSPHLEQMWFDEGNESGGFHPDGQHILLGGIKGYTLCSIKSSQSVSPRVGEGHDHASLEPTHGRLVVTGGGDANPLFTLWDVASGERLRYLQEPNGDKPFHGDCLDLRFSPDGRWIVAATCEPGGIVVIWNAETGRTRCVINYAKTPNVGWTDSNAVLCARLDASGQRLVTTDRDKRAIIWDCETGQPLRILNGHGSYVNNACFGHQHTNWLLTCSFDHTARLWDLQKEQPLLRVEHESDGIQDVQFAPDDRVFLTGGLDSTVRIWDSETGRMLPPILRLNDRVLKVQVSPNAKHLLGMTHDGVARVWNMDLEKPIATTSDFSSDGRLELTHEGTTAHLKDSVTGLDVMAPMLLSNNISALSFAGGRRFLALSHAPGTASVEASQIQLWDFGQPTPVSSPLAYDPSRANLVCSPDGSRFAFFQAPGKNIATFKTNDVLVWQPERGSATLTIAFPDEIVECVAFDRTSSRLVVGSVLRATEHGMLRLINLQGSEKSAGLLNNTQRFGNVTFSEDGQWLAAACWDRTLYPGDAVIWRVAATGRSFDFVSRLKHRDGVLYTTFSDSGNMIATASEDKTAMVWYSSRGTWQSSLHPFACGGEAYACTFSHNGRWLATVCRTPESQQAGKWSSQIRIWDIPNNVPLCPPLRFLEKVTRLIFVAEDKRLFVEHWVPPAPPERRLIDLGVDKGWSEELVLQTELLSAQRSFLSGGAEYLSQARQGKLSAEEALLHATSIGPRLPLSKEDCRELWRHCSSSR
jgi:WD40 repeat protein